MALQIEDIDFEKRSVKICRTFSRSILRKKTKGRKDRILPLDDELYNVLKGLNRISGFAFTYGDGKYHYTSPTVSRIWTKALKDANVKYVKVHEWGRHSFATQAIQRGVPIYSLKEWLGHTKIEMTERYISEVTKALEIVKRPWRS